MLNNLQEKLTKFNTLTAHLLFETQRIERLLKKVLVLTKYDGSSSIIECLEKSKVDLDKKSLGLLLDVFKKNAEINPHASNTFQIFLDNRNQFVHHLIELPGLNVSTIEGLEIGISFIQEYRKSLLLFESMLVPTLIMNLVCWLFVYYDDDLNDPLKKDIMSLRERLDIVNKLLIEKCGIPVIDLHELSAPDGTLYFHDYLKWVAIIDAVNTKSLDKLNLNQKVIEIWGQQEIIIALKEIGVNCVDNQGWAALSTCDKLLRQNYPNIKLADYGFEKLSVLIEISNVFEIKKDNTALYFRPVQETKSIH